MAIGLSNLDPFSMIHMKLSFSIFILALRSWSIPQCMSQESRKNLIVYSKLPYCRYDSTFIITIISARLVFRRSEKNVSYLNTLYTANSPSSIKTGSKLRGWGLHILNWEKPHLSITTISHFYLNPSDVQDFTYKILHIYILRGDHKVV